MSKDSVCYVYLMEDLLYSGIKIGISDDPKRRKIQLEHEFSTKISIRYIIEYPTRRQAFKQERKMHRRFARYRQDGEWFRISIEQIMNTYPALDYEAIDVETHSSFMDDLVVVSNMRTVLVDMDARGTIGDKIGYIVALIDTFPAGDPRIDILRAGVTSLRDFLGERRYISWRIGEIKLKLNEEMQGVIVEALWEAFDMARRYSIAPLAQENQ